MSVTETENSGEICPEAGFDNMNTFRVSVQYVDNQEGISEDTFEDDNILIRPTVKFNAWRTRDIFMDKLCMIHLRPQTEPDIGDEGIVVNMKEDEGQELYYVHLV